jgi:hypothetical protein
MASLLAQSAMGVLTPSHEEGSQSFPPAADIQSAVLSRAAVAARLFAEPRRLLAKPERPPPNPFLDL